MSAESTLMGPIKIFTVVHAFTALTGLGLQLIGVYATAATFGGWTTVALYGLGMLATLLQRGVVRRTTSC